jgi:hypothetical protein
VTHPEPNLNDFQPLARPAANRAISRPVPACRIVVRKRTNFGAALAAHWLGAALVLAAGTGNAMARQDTMAPPPAEKAPLGGPAVNDRAAPGERPFGEPMPDKANAKFARKGAPHGMFLRAVGEMDGPLELTDEQESQLRQIESEFREQMKAFREKNAEAFKQLRTEAGLGQGPGGPGGPDGPEGARKGGKARIDRDDADPKVKEARAKLKEIMQNAPKPDEAQGRQWAVLNDEQREFVKRRMEEFKEQGPRGGDRRRGPGGPDAGPDERRPEGGPPRRERGPRPGRGPAEEMRRGPDGGPGGPEGRRGPGLEARERRRGGPDGPEGRRGPEDRGGPEGRRRPEGPREFAGRGGPDEHRMHRRGPEDEGGDRPRRDGPPRPPRGGGDRPPPMERERPQPPMPQEPMPPEPREDNDDNV